VVVGGGRYRAPVTAPVDTAELRKARGAFFTPPELCTYVVDWAVRETGDQVLEPSCGEAAFLLAAGERLRALGATTPSLYGHELHLSSAYEARRILKAAGHSAEVSAGDFFQERPEQRFDAVVGNPPYVRYQSFAGASRAVSREAALRAGVALTRLASSWAAFTVHAALFLRPGGRLGLVLPAELLSVNYASEVRRFLMRHFGRVRLVLFAERVFPGVLEEVVLLLAEGTGPTDHCELLQVRDVEELSAATGVTSTWRPIEQAGKWTAAMMPPAALEAFTAAVGHPGFTTLHTWGKTTLGAVTGNNKWFTMSPARARELRLAEEELLRLSPPGSGHLRRLSFTTSAWRQMGEQGASTLLFRPPGEPSAAAARYIAQGRRGDVNAAYKCRVRKPWWRVPVVPPADLLLTYMNADTPRLTTNQARVHHVNSVHGIYLREDHRRMGTELLPLASLNTVTLLGAETVGRAYGGGMLKLEPREADLLPVPAPSLVAAAQAELQGVRATVQDRLRAGRLLEAAGIVDDVLLRRHMGLDERRLRDIEDAHAILTARRVARGRGRR